MHMLGKCCWGGVECATNVIGCSIVASDELPAMRAGTTVSRRDAIDQSPTNLTNTV